MATTYYVDPAGSNTAPYDTWAKAALTLQTCLDIAVVTDIIYCRTHEHIAASIDVDTNAGTNAAGWIKVIGCNAAGNVDGTRYVINGDAAGIHIMTFTTAADMYWFENIEATNTGAGTKHGFYASTADSRGCVLINCCANNCSGDGFSGNFSRCSFIRCVSYSNTSDGFALASNSTCTFLFCAARDNTGNGWNTPYDTLIGCIAHGNTGDQVSQITSTSMMFNCVVDGGSDDGIVAAAHANLYFLGIFGCRITNHSVAGKVGYYGGAGPDPVIMGWCYFEDNIDNLSQEALTGMVPLEGGSTTSNIEDQANTLEGYVDKANHDFSTGYTSGTDPSLRRTKITIPWS